VTRTSPCLTAARAIDYPTRVPPPTRTHEPLVGRIEELARVRAALVTRQSWLVTLWGPAGIGKTRIALETARACADDFDSGACVCALDSARRAHDLARALGQALDATIAGARSEEDAIARAGRALGARGAVLVVLDNVEQALDPAARAIAAWHTVAPAARFLVTSRELLGVPGEIPVEIPPLGLPDGSDVEASDAVRLLLERARAVRPELRAEPSVLRAIVERLDGIPLAIELAAARLSVLSADQLLERLDRRFEVLSRTHGGGEPRQRTLRGAIDWSWDLLGEHERRVLSELSVFRGGFDLEAAEGVLGPDVLDALFALRHKSLLATSLPESVAGSLPDAGAATPRFRLLESVRAYAAERLGERSSDVQARHAQWYVRQGMARAERVDAADGLQALSWLAQEQDNVLAVVHAFLGSPSQRDAAIALDALAAVEPVLATWGPVALLAELLGRALAASARFDVPRGVRVRALAVLGRAHLAHGGLADAQSALEQALALAEAGDDLGRARLENALGDVKQAQGALDEAHALQRRALEHAEGAGAAREQALALASRAVIQHIRGDLVDARASYERALVLHAQVHNANAEVRTRARLGFLLLDIGRIDEATECFERALAQARRLRGRRLEGVLLGYLGNAMRARGQVEGAAVRYDEALALLRAAGDRRFEATFLMDVGILLLQQRRWAEARERLAVAGAIAGEVGDERLTALAAAYEATARASAGDHAGARDAVSRARAAASSDVVAGEIVELHAAYVAATTGESPETARTLLRAAEARPPRADHERIGRELLAQAIDARAPPDDALVVTVDAGRVRPPAAAWVDLSARPALRRVLATLVDQRVRAPGVPLAADALVRAAWPGERLVRQAGANRLRVAVATLRAHGMRGLIQRTPGGYLLDPNLRVVRLLARD
jgi:predicted ATPase